jgi:beta-lactam-binding protein with PASTA domain
MAESGNARHEIRQVSASIALVVAAVAVALAAVALAPASTARKVAVPNVVGLQEANALKRLRAAALRPYVVRVRSLQPVDAVVAQRPHARAKVAPRTRVTISVSRGPGP